jgi:glyceraldehyde 3-phosphate dehydrogenase
LQSESAHPERYTLEGNFLMAPGQRTRLMCIDTPMEMPWDIFGVDLVIDATGVYRSEEDMRSHLAGGAPRVMIRTLPEDNIDRIVIPGINEDTIDARDRLLSAGSPTTTALCLLLHILGESFVIECGNMTSVHAYTRDQSLQDYAGSDYRRSRSAPKNIIPNSHEAGDAGSGTCCRVLRASCTPRRSTCRCRRAASSTRPWYSIAMTLPPRISTRPCARARNACPGASVAEDPIVSSDVLGSDLSLLFDAKGTLKAGDHFIKTLGWYETRGHAARMLEVARLYAELDNREEAA